MTTTTHDDVDHRTSYHAPTEAAVRLHTDLREQVAELAHYVIDAVPDCPERDRALQLLTDDVLMGLNAAVARNHDALG